METTHGSHMSTFLARGFSAEANSLASIHLKRDLQVPVVLQETDENDEGYEEGKVTNTRFGSFPHSTLIGVPWGAQIPASAVNTGSRGRRKQGVKRKRGKESAEAIASDQVDDSFQKEATNASSGFAHLLPPTPESWTISLPHRTQVVYTPDYSYILHRLRVRPGTTLIEAGAGSGSFTHAAVRSAFDGYPSLESESDRSKVFSFEFHDARYETLREELDSHGLSSLVHLTLRDVCEEGFQIAGTDKDYPTVQANAVFLDLPAPWLALPHLSRQPSSTKSPFSSLDHKTATRICTFSPCIEQVQRTVSALRAHGWVEIEMVEIAAKRINVRRERVGIHEEGLRGVNATPATVEESLSKLRELEKRAQMVHAQVVARTAGKSDKNSSEQQGRTDTERKQREKAGLISKQDRLQSIKDKMRERKIHLEGRLVHRIEADIKTHTSYLVFAVLPRAWSEEDEISAQKAAEDLERDKGGKSKKQLKREAREAKAQEEKA